MKEGADGKWAQGKKQETGEKRSARKTRGAAGVGSAEDIRKKVPRLYFENSCRIGLI